MHTWKNNGKTDSAKSRLPIPGWTAGVLAGVLFLSMGAVRGEFTVIFQKAVMICLECIGIG